MAKSMPLWQAKEKVAKLDRKAAKASTQAKELRRRIKRSTKPKRGFF